MNINKFEDHCCGCGECFAVCPVNAIEMKKNFQGFYYPEVKEDRCIQCGKCVKHCTFNFAEKSENSVKEAYALKHRNEQIRAESRSGGIFTALSDLILEAGGVVYGCTLVDCKEAVHIRATTREQRDACRGSKYIQSKIFDLFDSVRRDLQNGAWVLFSGTACQVRAVQDFCRGVDERLLTVDLVCHGVPSPKVWQEYLKYVCKKEHKKAVAADFRDKKRFGWADHQETVEFSDGTAYSSNQFTRLFYDHLIIRKDCFDCPYKNVSRFGDISIADCWGIEKHYPEFNDDKGVSLVLVNTDRGLEFFRRLGNVQTIPVQVEKLLQPPLKQNWHVPGQYQEFWDYFSSHSMKKTIMLYVTPDERLMIRLKRKVYGILKKLKAMIRC